MDNLFIMALFGHFVGDFILQHRLMADNKYRPGWNATWWCTLHVAAYSLTVAVFVGNFSTLFLLGLALPHFVADRWSLAYQWMKLIGRGDLIPNSNPTKAAFGAIIYVVIDQTYHLGCLYILLQVIYY